MNPFIKFLAVGAALLLGLVGLLFSMCGGTLVFFDRGTRHIDWGAAAYLAGGLAMIIAALALMRQIDKWSQRDRER